MITKKAATGTFARHSSMKNELSQLIDEYRSLSAGVVNFDLFDQMAHTHHSTALEGSSLTRPYWKKGLRLRVSH